MNPFKLSRAAIDHLIASLLGASKTSCWVMLVVVYLTAFTQLLN